jgi:hypothetical protein
MSPGFTFFPSVMPPEGVGVGPGVGVGAGSSFSLLHAAIVITPAIMQANSQKFFFIDSQF